MIIIRILFIILISIALILVIGLMRRNKINTQIKIQNQINQKNWNELSKKHRIKSILIKFQISKQDEDEKELLTKIIEIDIASGELLNILEFEFSPQKLYDVPKTKLISCVEAHLSYSQILSYKEEYSPLADDWSISRNSNGSKIVGLEINIIKNKGVK